MTRPLDLLEDAGKIFRVRKRGVIWSLLEAVALGEEEGQLQKPQ